MADAHSVLFRRFSAARVTTALKDTPVVMVNGPRQCGKTTLVREFANRARAYITLDDDTALEAARDDPAGFLRGLDRVIIDEVQRAPDLLRAIKRSVDGDRRPGRFLLTGSANVLTLPQVSESLAGRMETVSLLPLSRAEIRDRKPAFLEKALAGSLVSSPETMTGGELVRAVLTGGYPEMLRRKDPKRRQAWAHDYVRAIAQRDVRDVAEVEKLDQVPRLLRVLAHHSGQLTNFAQIGPTWPGRQNHEKVRCSPRTGVPRAPRRALVPQPAQAACEDAPTAFSGFRLACGNAGSNRGANHKQSFSARPDSRDIRFFRSRETGCLARRDLHAASLSGQGSGRDRHRRGKR